MFVATTAVSLATATVGWIVHDFFYKTQARARKELNATATVKLGDRSTLPILSKQSEVVMEANPEAGSETLKEKLRKLNSSKNKNSVNIKKEGGKIPELQPSTSTELIKLETGDLPGSFSEGPREGEMSWGASRGGENIRVTEEGDWVALL